jgi:hypothetical protein
MAHFAKLNGSNIVEEVIVIDNAAINNEKFPKSEALGQKFIKSIGLEGKWLQTSYNGSFRKNFAGKSSLYDSTKDAFIYSKPYPSWVLNSTTCKWESPTPMPQKLDLYNWDEDKKQWTTD